MVKLKNTPKLKKGKWFYKIRGSYLPATPEGWLLHSLLLLSGICVMMLATEDSRPLVTVLATTVLQLVGLGALFTWLAAKKA